MALTESEAQATRRSARRARLSILAQVTLATLLAATAVVLVTWLSERRGFRVRVDLTQSGENTLDPKSLAVIEDLPDDIAIDVFFRPEEFPLHEVGALAQDRMRKLLRRAQDESAGRIRVEEHDLSDPGHLSARTQGRKTDLKLLTIEPGGLFVVSSGNRREQVRLRPDIADIDPGIDPRSGQGPYVPARMVHFRGEEALMSALLKVTQGESKKVLFTQGHGELALGGVDDAGLSKLETALEGDGFEVAAWDGMKDGALPLDCSLLAIVGPEQALSAAEWADIRSFVEGGGHLIAAPGQRPIAGESSLVALLSEFGIDVRPRGVVARPLPTATGQWLFGIEECGDLSIDPSGMAVHPITEPLRRANRRVLLWRSHVLERGTVPPGGRVLDLLRAPIESWYELPLPETDDQFDWQPSETAERGRFTLAMQSSFPLRRPARTRGEGEATVRPECRVIAVGTSAAFVNARVDDNRDFLLNAFNWLEGREYRVMVSRVSPQARRIDVQAPGVLSRMHSVAVIALPLACALLGLLTAWLRHRR